jgi:hypothetical protein
MRSASAIVVVLVLVSVGVMLAKGVWIGTSTETATGKTVWCKFLTFTGIDRIEASNTPPYCPWWRP